MYQIAISIKEYPEQFCNEIQALFFWFYRHCSYSNTVHDVTVQTSLMLSFNLFLGSILMITPVALITIFSLYRLWDLRLIRNVTLHCV